jgi:accessory gene regulator B
VIHYLSSRTAASIKRQVPQHQASQEVLRYALSMILNVLFIITFTIGFSLFTGKTKEAIAILISFAILRQLTGGAHLKSGDACVILTTGLFTTLSFYNLSGWPLLIMGLVSLSLVLRFAPIGIDKQSRIPKKHYPKLKAAAALLIVISLFLDSAPIAISFLAQSITLIHRREVKH